MKDWQFVKIIGWLIVGLGARFYLLPLLESENHALVWLIIVVLLVIGVYLIQQTASIIEKTTGVLKDRTGLAGGLLQALGTAFPDMVIGVVSAILSLQAAAIDITRSMNLAIIAASTTFGSNIYNILHAAWCVYRQNKADKLGRQVLMFPGLKWSGVVKPLKEHKTKPGVAEVNAAMEILVYLGLLTLMVAVGMVLFGKVDKGDALAMFPGDLYQLTKTIGVVVLLASLAIIYVFRRSHATHEGEGEENYYFGRSSVRIWLDLLLSGLVILLAAESLIEAVTMFSELTGVPYVLTGIITALVGCLGEMIVIHNFSVNPKGRLADAITGVVMDNVVTIIGACLISIIGGIFLGSDALIIIFVVVLFSKIVLIHEVAELKDNLK
ncbi:MAG: hypothetical protein ACOZAR_04435 [Patescibacteria group bacterium]